MHEAVAELHRLDEALSSLASRTFSDEAIPGMSDADLAELLATTGRIQRRIESMQIEATAQVVERSAPMRDDRITVTYGCASPVELLRRLTLDDGHAARRLVRAAGFLRRERSMTEGCFLPARFPELREAVISGHLGLAGLLAAITPLHDARHRILDEQRAEADRQLAAFAHGIDSVANGAVTAGPLPTPEEIGMLSRTLVAYLDPDGAEPSDSVGARKRGLTLGVQREGSVPVHGNLLPEVAAQLNLLWDSLLSPRIDAPDEPDAAREHGVHFEPSPESSAADHLLDPRTRAQKQHDAFAAILSRAAATGDFPAVGGAAPTLVVTVTADDYVSGTGWASMLNTDGRIPSRVAAQTACAGGVQRVLFDESGRIVSIGTSARVFNALQRRAITLRDGNCIIPGCTVPATWCEIHHVREHADGGPTHTDNGVLLCWWHHRNLHLSEWRIRMNDGVPEVRGPRWWDRDQTWRPGRTRIKARAG